MRRAWPMILVLAMAGCGSVLPGLTDRENWEQLREQREEQRRLELLRRDPPSLILPATGPAAGGTQLIAFGDGVLENLVAVMNYSEMSKAQQLAERERAAKEKLTILGYALGAGILAVIVIGLLRYFGMEGRAKAVVQAAADQAGKSLRTLKKEIVKWVAVRDSPGTTEEARAVANQHVSELNTLRDRMTKTT